VSVGVQIALGGPERAELARPWRDVLARHSKSFDLAARLLRPEARDDVALLYAWCRNADDAIDLARPDEQRAALLRLEAELEAPRTALGGAFAELCTRARIPPDYPKELLLGMRMDVEGVRYASLDDLLVYCHRVAGVVGLMLCHVLGVSDGRALRNAAHLGIAMQLSNVCRDVLEDWGRGRLYLPDDRLERAGAPGLRAQVGAEISSASRAALTRVVRELTELANRFYASADRGIPALDPRSAFAVRVARLVYSAIGSELRARRFDACRGRVVVPRWKKLFLVGRALLETLARRLRPGTWSPVPILPPTRFPHDVLPV